MKGKSLTKTLAYVLIVLYTIFFCTTVAMVGWNNQQRAGRQVYLSINEVAADIQSGKIDRTVIDGDGLRLIYKNGEEMLSLKSPDTSLGEQLTALGVDSNDLVPENVQLEEKPQNVGLDLATWLGYAISFFLLALPIFGLIWFIRRQQG